MPHKRCGDGAVLLVTIPWHGVLMLMLLLAMFNPVNGCAHPLTGVHPSLTRVRLRLASVDVDVVVAACALLMMLLMKRTPMVGVFHDVHECPQCLLLITVVSCLAGFKIHPRLCV